jgi:hypothetical protein
MQFCWHIAWLDILAKFRMVGRVQEYIRLDSNTLKMLDRSKLLPARSITFGGSTKENIVPRIFLNCTDAGFLEKLRNSFLADGDFDVCVEYGNGIDIIMEAVDLLPDLVILGDETSQICNFEIAEALKLGVPEVQVFLVMDIYGMEAEKEALGRGSDAVFERHGDLNLLVKNARAACGLLDSSRWLN